MDTAPLYLLPLVTQIVNLVGKLYNILIAHAAAFDDNGDKAVKAAENMSSDISDVMNTLSDDMKTALPTDFSVDGNIKNSVNTQGINGSSGGLSLVLNITNFNNYSNEDINQLTNEIMETAGQFAKRKGMVFA